MEKIGNKTASASWGSNPGRSKAMPDKSADLAFKLALEVGSRNESSGKQTGSGETQEQASPVEARPFNLSNTSDGAPAMAQSGASTPATTVYETTQIMSCEDFASQFPEAKTSIQPLLNHMGHKKMPSIAVVSCSNSAQDGEVQKIGNTIFLSRNSTQIANGTGLDGATLERLVNALALTIGSN